MPRNLTPSLDEARPRADGCVAPAIRQEDSQSIGGAWLAMNGDQHPAASGQRLVDPRVVCLKSDTTHGARESKLSEIAPRPVERSHKRAFRQDRSGGRHLEPVRGRAERALDERRNVRTFFRDNTQGLGEQSLALEGVDARLRPLDILKDAHREASRVDADHDSVMYHGARMARRDCYCDVAVIGAGPAGACTAAQLARLGARVVLIDPSHPREKPCGGGITGRALALVEKVVALGDLRSTSVRAARFLDTTLGRSVVVSLDEGIPPALVVSSRTHFDGLLYAAAQQAGAEALAERVTGVAREARGFRIETTGGRSLQAAFVVGADGPNGLVRRRLASPFRRDQLSIATGYFVSDRTSDEIVIEIVDDPPGYIWSFPRHDHLAIGICAQADAGVGAGALRDRVARWIEASRVGAGGRLEPYSWPI
ncbi:MAG: hypothetical protein DMF90_18450, partial [Acidobacteria bacterium]